jgi:two-component system sensor histidine kinase AlgZ
MASINQNVYPRAAPDFRNLGVVLRTLVLVNLMAIVAALVRAHTLGGAWNELLQISALVQPLLIVSLLVLMLLSGWLQRLAYRAAIVSVLVLVLALAVALYFAGGRELGLDAAALQRGCLLTLLVTLIVLGYFDLRARALSPALTEARLQALQARIRPHFLFNSLNAVLSLIRENPRRAENALEDMAELFRVLMADNRELSPLSREVALCRQYLDLEALRLGERLQVEWHVDNMPGDALVPPLVLQPLLENAVYHGIEPRVAPGVISINIFRRRNQVHAVLRNPYQENGSHHAGNRMALNNIRERLQLHFDVEATLSTRITADSYQVHIVMPYRVRHGNGGH